MSRRFPICLLFMAALAIALAVALRMVIGQRKTIADLRAQIEKGVSASRPDAPSAPSPNEPPPMPAPEPSAVVSAPLPAGVTNQGSLLPSPEVGALQQQNENLGAKLRELEKELTETKRLVPEPEDPAAAYVGPGTWLNANGQSTDITKIVMSGEATGSAPAMRIAAWGHCSPTDCEWGEVPFFLLNVFAPKTKYRRGLAVWETEGWSKYLIVDFEKSGLKAECISVAKQRASSHHRTIEIFTRVN